MQSRFPAALQRCVYIGSAQKRNTQPALLHKKLLACARLLPQSCDSAPNTAPSQPFYFQNYFPKAASLLSKDVNCSNINKNQNRSPQLCWTAAPEKLRPRAATSAPREVVSESGSKGFFLQLLPKAAVLHGKCPSVLPFPKARLQSNGRKAALLQTSSAQAIIRSGFRNLLPKLAMTTELPFRLGL